MTVSRCQLGVHGDVVPVVPGRADEAAAAGDQPQHRLAGPVPDAPDRQRGRLTTRGASPVGGPAAFAPASPAVHWQAPSTRLAASRPAAATTATAAERDLPSCPAAARPVPRPAGPVPAGGGRRGRGPAWPTAPRTAPAARVTGRSWWSRGASRRPAPGAARPTPAGRPPAGRRDPGTGRPRRRARCPPAPASGSTGRRRQAAGAGGSRWVGEVVGRLGLGNLRLWRRLAVLGVAEDVVCVPTRRQIT
jgi:hypothetical protein